MLFLSTSNSFKDKFFWRLDFHLRSRADRAARVLLLESLCGVAKVLGQEPLQFQVVSDAILRDGPDLKSQQLRSQFMNRY